MARTVRSKTAKGTRRGARDGGTAPSVGWATSDEDEVARRQRRGLDEAMPVAALARGAVFGDFRVGARSGESYLVEIRSLRERTNTCTCADHKINGLGTCKHVAAVLGALERQPRKHRAAAAAGSPWIEIYLDRRDHAIRIAWPLASRPRSAARTLLGPFFGADGKLAGDPLARWGQLERAVATARAHVRRRIRVSPAVADWVEGRRARAARAAARNAFEADLAAGRQSLDIVKVKLYPYQQAGVAHLAFTGRALLADEMGLGKTVQAVAACELLRRLEGIERVLVVSPASLKAEWEEQIAKFTDLSVQVIEGPRARRLKQYRERPFFHLANYEQVRPDWSEMNRVLAPDVVILDEAQRIKNWQSKTAQAVKRLASRHAFVLTGTPIENRIDEIYSIVQFLDPHVFGPLFRFNRDFHQLDSRGRPEGYRNLDELHRRLRPVMLRRRKAEVEKELPGRTVNTYFVPMHVEQRVRYDEYSTWVARLLAHAKRRPLSKAEMDKLQQWLACMRMLCDTPYILDPECTVCPKLAELEEVLEGMLTDARKVIVFSEWERMLQLVRGLAKRMDVGFAWHTGSTPQRQRRAEIRTFKTDPECRLFLSTDAGSVGLNLQVASAVVNLDLPWNPARLEQRIARAWRKHQARPVQVVNLVSEDTIEHRMIGVIESKRELANGVLDGAGKLSEMKLPSARLAMVERLEGLLRPAGSPAAAPTSPGPDDPGERLRDDLLQRLGERVQRLEVHASGTGAPTVLAVLDRVDDDARKSLAAVAERSYPGDGARLELLDHATFEAIRRLVDAGVLHADVTGARVLHRAAAAARPRPDPRARRLQAARHHFEPVERQRRLAEVLVGGGFAQEALAPLREGLETALESLALLEDDSPERPLPIPYVESKLVASGVVPSDTVTLLGRLRETQPAQSPEAPEALATAVVRVLRSTAETLDRAPSGGQGPGTK